MNILLIHQYFLGDNESGGSRWNEMTKVWKAEGHQISVLAGMVHYANGTKDEKFKGKFYKKEFTKDGIEVLRCHVSEAYNLNFLGRLWAYFSFVFSSVIIGVFFARKKYDIIVVTSPPLFVGITAYILSILKRIPFLFEIRDLWPESAIDTGVITNPTIIKFAYWFESFIYKRAKKINALTPAFKEVLIQKKNVDSKKIIYIPNAADFSLSENLLQNFNSVHFKEALGLKDNFVITYVGAHGVANHLIQILEVAERMKKSNVFFLLIGEGMQKKQLKDIAFQKKLSNVRFIDAVPKEEVFKYILASDMGASILKKNDTFKTVYSNKTFDYMSCKKPILMAIDGVSRALVEEAQAGVFVEPENIEDYIKKINIYVNNPELGIHQGENGYLYAKQSFDREKLALSYLTEISKCI